MSREAEVATYLQADDPLNAILTGGIYANSELGREGITQDSCPDCYDPNGYLLPCAIVKARGDIPDTRIADEGGKVVAQSLMVEIWLYEDVSFAAIDAARARLFTIMHGHKFSGAWPAEWAFTTPPMRDEGSLSGSSMQRVDFQIRSLNGVTA
jgi:hypothetical protein